MHTAPVTTEEPRRLGKYVVRGRMASGGMAEVFHAESASGVGFGGPIVVKQMRIIADMTDDRWFRREARRYLDDFSG